MVAVVIIATISLNIVIIGRERENVQEIQHTWNQIVLKAVIFASPKQENMTINFFILKILQGHFFLFTLVFFFVVLTWLDAAED